VNGTIETISRRHNPHSSDAGPVFRRRAGRNIRQGRGVPVAICAFPGHTSLTEFPACPSPPRRPRPSSPVAYYLPEISRLGYSPKLAPHRAYHNMSCRCGCNTNQQLNKKTGGPSSLPLRPGLSQPGSPVIAILSPARGSAPLHPRACSGHSHSRHSINPKKDYLHV
jgi:hypothetical protein